MDASAIDGASRAALEKGGYKVTPLLTVWPLAPWCSEPIARSHYYRKERARDRTGREIVLLTACRQCVACRDHRFQLWGARAAAEFAHADHTVMITLTLGPTARWQLDARARAMVLDPDEEVSFSERWPVMLKDVQAFIKRLREQQRRRHIHVRYMVVIEPHKDGMPHAHLLLHQYPRGSLANWNETLPEVVRTLWGHGFIKISDVADERGCFYVAKYLCKEGSIPVRASQNYGEGRRTPDEVKPPRDRLAGATSAEESKDHQKEAQGCASHCKTG